MPARRLQFSRLVLRSTRSAAASVALGVGAAVALVLFVFQTWHVQGHQFLLVDLNVVGHPVSLNGIVFSSGAWLLALILVTDRHPRLARIVLLIALALPFALDAYSGSHLGLFMPQALTTTALLTTLASVALVGELSTRTAMISASIATLVFVLLEARVGLAAATESEFWASAASPSNASFLLLLIVLCVGLGLASRRMVPKLPTSASATK